MTAFVAAHALLAFPFGPCSSWEDSDTAPGLLFRWS
jgi:hypothetical protein